MTSIVDALPGIEDPDKLEMNYKISKYITEMPAELQDRFKALKTLADECYEFEEERENEIHTLDLMY